MTRSQLRAAARRILRAGLRAVEPAALVRASLRHDAFGLKVASVRLKVPGRVFLVSVGKAAVPMARAAQDVLGERITSAIVIAPEAAPRMARTRSFVSSHPIPDVAGVRAARHVIGLLEQAEREDLVLLLLSGGASALMPAPVEGVLLRDKQRITQLLLLRGANIAEVNAVRQKLSRLKNGGFARLAAPARVVTLALSDVPGDDVRIIGSGPAVEDPRAGARARRTIRKFLKASEVPARVRRALERPRTQGRTPVSGITKVIGSGRTFAEAAGRQAHELGFRTRVLPGALQGEARTCGPRLVARFDAQRGPRPSCLVATGETVVTVRGAGQGGRNQELALSAVPFLARLHHPTVLLAFATDGRDGKSVASGGLVDDRTEHRAAALGISIHQALDQNNSSDALDQLKARIITGPTGTNVADVTVVVG